ncbi:box C/D snoRNA protein 1-like [Amphiura filiformis]|uniref:box C/D snoRNA protein 1-like n=1 Tax=Amphiura filiformis TaxID=82378 RepID=UPI003B222E01
MSCEVCQEVQSKYKCPRCGLKTCSLHCVKRHKVSKKCSGIRDKTAYVPIKQFKESHLLSDYRFLEDVDRKAYGAKRDPNLHVPARTNGWLPKQLHQLRKTARQRGVNLMLLPATFSRHKANTSGFKQISKGRSVFHWRVEWQFPQCDVTYVNDGVPETSTLRIALEEYIDPTKANPVYKQRLKHYCAEGMDAVRLFMKIEDCDREKIRYNELKLDQTLAGNLARKCVLEFPTVIVALKDSVEDYLDKPEQTSTKKTETDASDDNSSTLEGSKPQ